MGFEHIQSEDTGFIDQPGSPAPARFLLFDNLWGINPKPPRFKLPGALPNWATGCSAEINMIALLDE